MPSPVMRIAPKPSRCTGRSPPKFQMESVADGVGVGEVSPKTALARPAISAAPLTRVVPRNALRLRPSFCFASEDFSAMTRVNYVPLQLLRWQARDYLNF